MQFLIDNSTIDITISRNKKYNYYWESCKTEGNISSII